MRLIAPFICVVLLGSSTHAAAQGTYVGAAVFADVVRTSHVVPEGSAGGEAVGFALRVGTPLGNVWGVEAEFALPSSIGEDTRVASTTIASPLLPPPIYDVSTSQRSMTFSAALWAQQQISARLSLVYAGGVSFYRHRREYAISYPPVLTVLPIGIPSFRTDLVTYGAGPVAGFESRIALTDHAQLVPGIRLHVAGDAWLLRPGVGLAWMF